MKYQSTTSGYIVRIEQGEEIIKSLKSFADKKNLAGGFFYGLGAVREASVGMFNTDKLEYEFQSFGAHEITNITGNIARKEEELIIHAHVTLADSKQRAFGGHLLSAIINPTCEMIFFSSGRMARSVDEETSLSLLDFPNQ